MILKKDKNLEKEPLHQRAFYENKGSKFYNMKPINIIKVITLFQIINCYIFSKFTIGLLFLDTFGKYSPISSLQSSGSDDDVSIFIISLLYFFYLIVLLFKKSLSSLIVLNILIIILMILSSSLMQMASVYDTILGGKNIILFIILNPIIQIIYITYINFKTQEV